MSIKAFPRHFQESWKSISRNAWMTVASVGAVSVTLLILGSFLVFSFNLNHIAKEVEDDVEIRVHISLNASSEEKDLLHSEINRIPEIKSISFSSKDQEFQKIVKAFAENGKYIERYEQDNPLHDVYIVKLYDPQKVKQVASQIELLPSVDVVKYGEEFVGNLFKFTNTFRYIGIVMIIALALTAVFLIANTIKITIYARKREIEIMRLVGAKNSYIRWPFFLEGLWLGVLGAIIPIIIIAFCYQYFIKSIPKTLSYVDLFPLFPFIYKLALLLIALGGIIGVFASLLSVRKFLKV